MRRALAGHRANEAVEVLVSFISPSLKCQIVFGRVEWLSNHSANLPE